MGGEGLFRRAVLPLVLLAAAPALFWGTVAVLAPRACRCAAGAGARYRVRPLHQRAVAEHAGAAAAPGASLAPGVMPWDYYEPVYACAGVLDLVGRRAAGAGDGAWVCGPLGAGSAVYAVGSGHAALAADLARAGCRVHVFLTDENEAVQYRQENMRGVAVAAYGGSPGASLGGVARADLVVVSADGDPGAVLGHIAQGRLRAEQVVVEMHVDWARARGMNAGARAALARDFAAAVDGLRDGAGLVLVHKGCNPFKRYSCWLTFGRV